MYLKSIEVHGFKSFANKILFQFHNGITGIVGPNGSGKSNVADAVRWVLGEQRIKQLRGATMQDVIFSGTELRKPLGYAYVAITLDNSDHQLAIDYDEVTVARRLVPFRRKRISDQRDTVSFKRRQRAVLRHRYRERRLFDHRTGADRQDLERAPGRAPRAVRRAAGIVKYKRRKDASVKKLESEQQNLVRVNDILSELEKQVEPLGKQAEKARVYLKHRETLKALDVNVFLLESEKTRAQLSDTEEKYRIADGDFKDTTTRYEGIKEEYDRIATQIEALERQMEQARAQLTDTSVLRGKLEGEIAVLQEKTVPSGAMKHICRAEKRRCARRLTHETPTKKSCCSSEMRFKNGSKSCRKSATALQQNWKSSRAGSQL